MNFRGFGPAAFGPVLEASWHASLLVVITLTIQWLFQKRIPPAWKHALWLPVVIRLLLPAVPESGFSFLNLGKMATEHLGGSRPKVTVQSNLPPPPDFNPVDINTAIADSANVVLLPDPKDQKPAFNPLRLASSVWLIGCVLLLIRTIAGACWFARRLHAEEVRDPALLTELESAKLRLNYRGKVTLQKSAAIESPALFGLLSPVLLIPRDLGSRLTTSELRHVFAHEIAHLKRGDLPAAWLMVLVQIVHWFNPLVWVAMARCRADRELACDELALSRMPAGEFKSYGYTILKLLELFPASRPKAGLVGILEEKEQMKKRIDLVTNFKPRKQFSWPAAALLCALVLCGLSKAAPDSDANLKKPVLVLAPPAHATNILDRVRIQKFAAENKSLDEVLQMLGTAITEQSPKETNLLQMQRWVALTGDTNNGVVYAVNAVGYINDPPGAPESFGKEVSIGSLDLHETTLREALDVIAANSNKKISWQQSARDGKIVFSRTSDEPARDRMELLDAENRLNAAKSQLQTLLVIYTSQSPAVQSKMQEIAALQKEIAGMAEAAALYTRTYRIDQTTFIPGIRRELGISIVSKTDTNDIQQLVRDFLIKAGIDFPAQTTVRVSQSEKPERQKAVFYNQQTGVLFVRATLKDLDVVESKLQMLSLPPQVRLDVKVIDLNQEHALDSLLKLAESNKLSSAHGISRNPDAAAIGILTQPQSKSFEAEVKKLSSLEPLSAPRVSTLSGRQARISIDPGPSIDLLPVVQPNGRGIYLRVSATVPSLGQNSPGPNLQGTATLWDGQMMILTHKEPREGSHHVILITPVIINSKGQPIYTAASTPEADTIPPQTLE